MTSLSAQIEQVIKAQMDFLEKVDKTLPKLPKGCLYRNKKKKHIYYYQSTYDMAIRHQVYLGTGDGENAQLIADLKRKRFLLYCKKMLEENVVALRACLLKYKEFDPAEISSRMAASYENIGSASKSPQHLDWRNAPYPKAEMHPESLKHEAIGGLMVRSKSEALIAFALDLGEVPFHYEEILELGDKKTAPDFTILHPRTGGKVYWEHFGMMDDPVYATETYRKLVLYGQNGIMPGLNLIYTMETNKEPLSIREVQRLVSYHFC